MATAERWEQTLFLKEPWIKSGETKRIGALWAPEMGAENVGGGNV